MNPRALYIPAGNIFANITATGQFLGGNGTAAAPSYSFTSDPTKGFFSGSANITGYASNGLASLYFGPTGQMYGAGGNLFLSAPTVGSVGITASGSNQSITLTPSGSGVVLINGSLQILSGSDIQSGRAVVNSALRFLDNGGTPRNLLTDASLSFDASSNATFAGLTRNFGGAAGAATTTTNFQKAVTAIGNAAATTVLTATIPNAAHSASIRVRLVGSLGAGGAIGANEASGTVAYDIAITRTAGVNAVGTISAAFGSGMANVAGAATITVTAALGAVVGAVGASNTIPIQVTITRGSGASANHTCQVAAEVVNANATGVTVS